VKLLKSILVATLSVATFASGFSPAAQAQVPGAGMSVRIVGSDQLWDKMMDDRSQAIQMKLLNYLNNPSMSDAVAHKEARAIVDGILGSADIVEYVRTAKIDNTAYAALEINNELQRMTESSHPAVFTQPVERMKWKIELLSRKIHTRRTFLHIRMDLAILTVGFYAGATLMMVMGGMMSAGFGGMGFFDSIFHDVHGMIMNEGSARSIAFFGAFIGGAMAVFFDLGRRISPYRPHYSKGTLRSVRLLRCEAMFTSAN
jgi:hypothetical protein